MSHLAAAGAHQAWHMQLQAAPSGLSQAALAYPSHGLTVMTPHVSHPR